MRRLLALATGVAGLVFAIVLMPGKISIWLDEGGVPTLSNRAQTPPGVVVLQPEDLELGWSDQPVGRVPRGTSQREDRFLRELLAARQDISTGEVRRGLRSLRRLQRERPGRPEPAWLLALAERQRGRLQPALDALDAALLTAGHMPDQWRQAAEELKGEIVAELAHSEQAYVEGERIEVDGERGFRLSYDHNFAGRQFGERVLQMLERARSHLGDALGGARLERTLEVRLYTRAAYLDAYEHRFGFATVGFYDGAIHVVSARHPREELFALLVHEYAHALFEDALGGHQPFFLNEGIADGEEERARGRQGLSRSEWRRLLDAVRSDDWIPLQQMVRGFGGLEGKRALLGYLESRAAVGLIEAEQPGAMGRWLARCDRGEAWPQALEAETGWDLAGLEHALRQAVEARFPPDPLARLPGQLSGAQ